MTTSCQAAEDPPPLPRQAEVSLTCRRGCQHRRLGNLFGFCDEMVSGDNKLPDICQREYAQGRGQRKDKRGQEKRQENKRLGLFSRRSLEKLPTDFPLYLMFLLCSGRSICTVRGRDRSCHSPLQWPQLPHLLHLHCGRCRLPDTALRRLAALFPLNAQTFHSLTASRSQSRTLPQRLPQLQLATVSADSHLGIIFTRNRNLAWRFGPS